MVCVCVSVCGSVRAILLNELSGGSRISRRGGVDLVGGGGRGLPRWLR